MIDSELRSEIAISMDATLYRSPRAYSCKPLDVLEMGDYLAIGSDPLGESERPVSLACRVTQPTDDRGYAKVWVLNGHWTARVWTDHMTHVEGPDGPFRPESGSCVGAEPRVLYIPDEWGQRRLSYKLNKLRVAGWRASAATEYDFAIRWLTDQYLLLRESGQLPVHL